MKLTKVETAMPEAEKLRTSWGEHLTVAQA